MKEDKDKEDVLDASIETEQVDSLEVEATVVADTETDAETEPVDELAFRDARIKELEQDVEDHKASYLRKHADFENFRKRMIKEKSDSIKHANESR
ncbi:MAG: nucleotide exchange factor GrpE [Spirochaetaceae bacterium 4572_7]|nr:MAG: nucleotide exchange factor GrpE [Spirochaetaceae bacterium 4572_7]